MLDMVNRRTLTIVGFRNKYRLRLFEHRETRAGAWRFLRRIQRR